MTIVRIGTRKSRLAVAQAEIVAAYIRNFCQGQTPRLVEMNTAGDRILDKTLYEIGGKGLFIKELERSLREGGSDISVHSLKDVPMEVAEDLPLLGFSQREDARDVLVLPKHTQELDAGLPLGSSSPRRMIQIKKLFPKMEVKSVRGNVLTRLKKLDQGGYSGLVLAAAGLRRLGLEDRISRYFSVEEMLPAAGQGMLAVQGRKGEDYGYLEGFFDADSAFCAQAERSYVKALGGGCSSPIAAYAVTDQDSGLLRLTGLYAAEGGGDFMTASITGPREEAARLGRELAGKMR